MPRDRQYIPNTFYRRDDRSGFKVRSFDTTKEWNGQWIRLDMAEERQPQDFVRGQSDEQAVPEPRPTPPAFYLGPLTTPLSTAANAGALSIFVSSSVRMSTGDTVEIMVGGGFAPDAEFQFRTTIANVASVTEIALDDPLPAPASVGALVTDLSAQATVNAANFPASNGGGGPGGTGL